MQPRTLEFLKKELNWKAQKPDTKFEFTPKELAELLEKYLKDFTDEFPGTYNERAKYEGGRSELKN